jgi:hypothetical protein
VPDKSCQDYAYNRLRFGGDRKCEIRAMKITKETGLVLALSVALSGRAFVLQVAGISPKISTLPSSSGARTSRFSFA